MHLDVGLQVVEAHSLFPYFLEKCLAIPTSPFFHLLVNGFSVVIIIDGFSRSVLKRSLYHLYTSYLFS